MALVPPDSTNLADARADAASTRAAVGTLTNLVGAVAAGVAAIRTELADSQARNASYVLDVDSPLGTVWIVWDQGAGKTWVTDGDQWGDLQNEWPGPLLRWDGETLAKIPTIGPEPPAPDPAPTAPSP